MANNQLLGSLLDHPAEAKAIPSDPWSIIKNALMYGLAEIPDLAYQASQGPWAPMMPHLPLSPTPTKDYLTDEGILKEEVVPSPKDKPSHYLDIGARLVPSLALPFPGSTTAKVGAKVGERLGTALTEGGMELTPLARQRGAVGDLTKGEKLGGALDLKREAGEPLPASTATLSTVLRNRVADITERLSQVTNRVEALNIISETGDIVEPKMRAVIGNAFKDAWDRFSHVPIEQQRAAQQIIGAPAPTTTAQPQSPLLAATIRDEQGTLWQLELKRDKAGYSWYKQTGSGMEPTGMTSATPEEARQVAEEIWPDSFRIQERAPAPTQTFGTPAEQARVQTLFKGIAERPESFQFGGKTASTDIDELAAHHSTPKNPLSAEENAGTITITNDRTGGYIKIYDADKRRPYIRSTEAQSEGQEQAGGKQMYQVANSWLANKGKTLAPDPSGISGINKLRKVENAISSYLRHGKEGYIDLSNATPARNLKELLVDAMNKVFKLRPDLEADLVFDGKQLMNPAGTPLSDETLTVMIKAKDPRFAHGIGVTTLKRALLTKWAMGAKKAEVIAAAKKFKEPILYTLSGLAVAKGANDSAQLGNLLEQSGK